MLSVFSLCLGFIACYLYGLSADNLPHRSSSQLYLILLGVGSGVQFTSLFICHQGIENLLHLSGPLRNHLSLGVGMCAGITNVYLSRQRVDIECMLAANFVCLSILVYFICHQGIENILHLSGPLRNHLSLGVGICGGITSVYLSRQRMDI